MGEQLLAGRKIAVLLESEYIPEEIDAYRERFGELGAELHFLSRLWGNDELTFLSDAVNEPSRIARQFTVYRDLSTVRPEEYDAIIMAANYTSVRLRQFDIPMGEKPSPALARTAPAVEFFAHAMTDKRIVKGALCHGLWILTPRPDLLKDRKVICHEVVLADIANAGATYVAAPTGVHVDGDLVTGRSKDEVYLFIDAITQQLLKISNGHARGSELAVSSAEKGAISSEAVVDRTVRKIIAALEARFAQAASNHSGGNRPVANAARGLLNGTLDVAAEVKRMTGVDLLEEEAAKHKPILLVASKFGTWAAELSLVASTLLRAGYTVRVATEDGSPPHLLGPSLDSGFMDGAWRGSVVSPEEQDLALRFLNPSTGEHALLQQGNVVDLRALARPPQVGDYLKDHTLLRQYREALHDSVRMAEQYDAIIVAGGSGAIPGLMFDRGLQNLILAFYDLGKPVMGECNGGLALAQTNDPANGKSILYDRAVTTHSWLDEYQSGWGWTAAFGKDTNTFWHNGTFDLKAYQAAETWVTPGIAGNPLIDSEALFKNAAAGPHGFFFSPPGTPYSVVVDGNLITCRTTPDGYPGVLALMAIMDGDPPLRGRLFIHADERGREAPTET
jgi:protease I